MGSGPSTAGQTNTPTVGTETEVGSAETYDTLCDVCKNPEKEVVGNCGHCGKNHCSKCRHCERKDEPGQADRCVGKKKGASLFERQLVPAGVEDVPYGYRKEEDKKNSVTCLRFSELSGEIFMFDKQPSGVVLKVINKGGSTIIEPNQDFAICANTFVCVPSSKTDRCIYCTAGWKCLIKINIDDSLKQTEQKTHFKTSGECYGIAQFDNGFALSVKLITGFDMPDWQIQYLDKDGKTKKQIFYDRDGKALFSYPQYLASNRTQDTLYVSDIGKKAVIALNVHGDVLFTFSHSDFKRPKDLTVDDEGNVYLANGDNVIQIHKSGGKHRLLLKKKEKSPDILSVCFNPVKEVLIVGENSNQLKTFNFLP